MAFKKGEVTNKRGGKPGNKGGTGRPPDEFRAKCRAAFEKGKVREYVAAVASGKPVETHSLVKWNPITKKNDVIEYKNAAETKDRLAAGKMLKEWGHGKDDQPVTVEAGKRLIFIFPEGSDD